ncbi:MAG: MBL fold metallo-hydrolase [Spirochaetales bacterium]|nr:MBL fold metallo-hydrolase [Spirochaetales bacterium]
MKNPGHIITVDCQYLYPRIAAAYLIVEGEEAMFVENNTSHAVPLLLAALKEIGLAPEQVRYAAITHVHLDHAGGTSALLDACPEAICLAHPRAAPHVINPARLIDSARTVYGAEMFDRLYGEIRPVDERRVRIMNDGEVLSFGDRELKFFYTKGHANHHFCIHDSASNGVFTGDSFGLAYPDLQKNGPFIYPSTTPTDFDPVEARITLEKIRSTGAKLAYLTHFGPFLEMQAGYDQMHRDLDVLEGMLEQLISCPPESLEKVSSKKMNEFFEEKMQTSGLNPVGIERETLQLDIDINAMGLAFQARRRQKK